MFNDLKKKKINVNISTFFIFIVIVVILKTVNPLVTNYTTLFLLHVNKLCGKQLEKKKWLNPFILPKYNVVIMVHIAYIIKGVFAFTPSLIHLKN